MKVKEFNEGVDLENKLNEWLKENEGVVNVLDIKYSVANFSESRSYDAEYFGCALVIYEDKPKYMF